MGVFGQPQTLLAIVHRFLCLPLILRTFSSLVAGSKQRLKINFPTIGTSVCLGAQPDETHAGRQVTLSIKRPIDFCWRMFLDRKLGLAEAYMDGDWEAHPGTKDLLVLLIKARREKLVQNPSKSPNRESKPLDSLATWFAGAAHKVASWINFVQHWWRQNTLSRSRQNIREHYDLGNEMFELFLDSSMTYSCAIFDHTPDDLLHEDDTVLEKAQYRKYDALLDRLDLSADDNVLEIGCGWGACAIHAVQRFGCRWTGLTLSEQQLAFARAKVVEAGLEDRIELKLLDYRLEQGVYTKVLAVEMIEAVGHEFLPEFFATIQKRMLPGGQAALQAILCPDDQYERYRNSSDFIKKHIFPGGHMPSLAAIREALPQGLEVSEDDILRLGQHYKTTLNHWAAVWQRRRADVLALGRSEVFFRTWEFYFALCSALFQFGNIDVVQMSLTAVS